MYLRLEYRLEVLGLDQPVASECYRLTRLNLWVVGQRWELNPGLVLGVVLFLIFCLSCSLHFLFLSFVSMLDLTQVSRYREKRIGKKNPLLLFVSSVLCSTTELCSPARTFDLLRLSHPWLASFYAVLMAKVVLWKETSFCL